MDLVSRETLLAVSDHLMDRTKAELVPELRQHLKALLLELMPQIVAEMREGLDGLTLVSKAKNANSG